MRCAQCQFDNPPAMKFCGEYGAKLTLLCPHCGVENQPTFKFCGECGTRLGTADSARLATSMVAEAVTVRQERSVQSYTPAHLATKILTSRSALEGERKQVTVLCTDVSGFTALAEWLDPEDVHQLMEHAFTLMLDEDHPIRAVHAALGMQHTQAPAAQQRLLNKYHRPGIALRNGARIAYYEHGTGEPTWC